MSAKDLKSNPCSVCYWLRSMLPVSPFIKSLFYKISLFIYHHSSMKRGGRGGWHFTRHPSSSDAFFLSSFVSLLPYFIRFHFICEHCKYFPSSTNIQHTPHSFLHHQSSWSCNSISSIHQAQAALINKHFESTPQHHAELKMSPLCLCHYLSLCWQSAIRCRAGGTTITIDITVRFCTVICARVCVCVYWKWTEVIDDCWLSPWQF